VFFARTVQLFRSEVQMGITRRYMRVTPMDITCGVFVIIDDVLNSLLKTVYESLVVTSLIITFTYIVLVD